MIAAWLVYFSFGLDKGSHFFISKSSFFIAACAQTGDNDMMLDLFI